MLLMLDRERCVPMLTTEKTIQLYLFYLLDGQARIYKQLYAMLLKGNDFCDIWWAEL